MKQGCEGVSPLHPTCQLPCSHPSKSHPGQCFLLIYPLVIKALNSSQIHRQDEALYFKNTLSPSTKEILEQAHQNPRIQTQVFSPFGFPSPICMTPHGPSFQPKSFFALPVPYLSNFGSLGSKAISKIPLLVVLTPIFFPKQNSAAVPPR